jgi:hypothetical protein
MTNDIDIDIDFGIEFIPQTSEYVENISTCHVFLTAVKFYSSSLGEQSMCLIRCYLIIEVVS